MTPANSRPLWFIVLIVINLCGVALVLLFTACASKNSHISLNDNELSISGGFCSWRISRDALLINQPRIIDLETTTELSPKPRTLGTDLPGWSSGWFRLRNNEKALLYVATRNQLIYRPTREGYSLLVSLDKPDAFLDKLKSG